jgi:hypothetical protein
MSSRTTNIYKIVILYPFFIGLNQELGMWL